MGRLEPGIGHSPRKPTPRMNRFPNILEPRTSADFASLLHERPVAVEQDAEAARLQELGTKVARIAHDLNNLLSPILMTLESFRPALDDAAHLMMLEIARKSTLRAVDLVKQITSFAKGAEEQHSRTDAAEIVLEVAGCARAACPKALDIRVDVTEPIAPIMANATQLHRALLNLCINARDAMPEGGTLTLRATTVDFDSAQIRAPRGSRAGRYVLFEVGDTGSGIPEEIREKIFEPFFTTKKAGHGTGLGLASVRAVVESHDGLLSLQTEIGKGTTFHILIPTCETGDNTVRQDKDLRIVAA